MRVGGFPRGGKWLSLRLPSLPTLDTRLLIILTSCEEEEKILQKINNKKYSKISAIQCKWMYLYPEHAQLYVMVHL